MQELEEFMRQVQQAADQIIDEGEITPENVFGGLGEYAAYVASLPLEERGKGCVGLAALAFLAFCSSR